jgi:DNA-binding MarR family transcriptional regulator
VLKGSDAPSVDKLIINSETNSEVLSKSFLEHLGVALLSEWDLLAFVYRHGPTLTSTAQIARLIGYESTVVGAALDRLESHELIERVGPPEGTRLHRMVVSTDAEQRRCIRQFVSLSETRAGRLSLTGLLMPSRLESRGEGLLARSGK